MPQELGGIIRASLSGSVQITVMATKVGLISVTTCLTVWLAARWFVWPVLVWWAIPFAGNPDRAGNPSGPGDPYRPRSLA
jgi:hypothetical protein